MESREEAEEFAAVASQFVRWVESEPLPAKQELATARTLLAKLCFAGLELPEPHPGEDYGRLASIGLEMYKKAHSRLSALPFQYYSLVFNALELQTQEPVTGDLHDDLADIHCDLESGLEYWSQREKKLLSRGNRVFVITGEATQRTPW
jgi:hypothetical protein